MIRSVTRADEAFLWEVLFEASHSAEDPGATLDTIKADERLARYVTGWGREGDHGVLAEGQGAAWLRLYAPEAPGFAFIDADTPELAIAMMPGHRGGGLGTKMIEKLIAEAPFNAICLSVRKDNPAFRLYERQGFRVVREITNRVGGISATMLRKA